MEAVTDDPRREGEAWAALVAVVRRLLAPGGCPWDREQTPETLRQYVIEEAYELCEAIDGGSPEKVREELGDLLMQVVFLSQIFTLRRAFTVADVCDAIREKLVRRHPHVFG